MAESENAIMGTAKRFSFEELQANLESGLANLLAIVAQATKWELENGPLWYSQGYSESLRLANLYNLPLESVIRCIACLSPQLRWSQNIILAEIVIRYFVSGGFVPSISDYKGNGGELKFTELAENPLFTLRSIPCNTTGANVLKALWILQGHYTALSGEKVLSFYENLARFADSQKVTVDSHAVLAWMGICTPLSATFDYRFYSVIEADYTRLAEIMRISPLEAQAIVWIVRRRLAGSDTKDHIAVDKLQAYLAKM
jgi:hypothetical protein